MSWCHFHRHECNVLHVLSKPPDMVFIHLDGNNVTTGLLSSVRNIVKRKIDYLRLLYQTQ